MLVPAMGTEPGPRATLAMGLLCVAAGAFIFLVAGDVIPRPDEKFHAPRWMVAVFGLAFFFAGWYLLSLLLPTPMMRQVLATATALCLLTGGAIFLTWLAWTGGDGGRATISIGPFSLLLPAAVARGFERVIVVFFALITDALALFVWYAMLRALVRSRAP
jgi:hypothetical protein